MLASLPLFKVSRMRAIARGFILFPALLLPLQAQKAAKAPAKSTPAKIAPHLVVMSESVVLNQWTHTLRLVNAPQNMKLLNPGQCIRVGIYATGDGRDAYLEKTRLAFEVKFAGKSQVFPAAALAEWKRIKPEGGDFVTAGLAAGGIKNPLPTMATMSASAAHWCVPADAQDGTATIEAEVESPSGREKIPPATIQIESFETGSKRAIKDPKEMESLLMDYYRQPNPARLLPMLQYFAADSEAISHPGTAESIAAFLSAALKDDPVAARDFETRLAAQPTFTRAMGLMVLRAAGYDVSDGLSKLSAADRKKFDNIPPLSDPFEIPMTRAAFMHLDMLWGVFGATGHYAPVNKVASTLAWRQDYEAFDKMRKSGQRVLHFTPPVVRGLTYIAAGWSLSSFQRNDPLVADYIEYMLASPKVSAAVKTELKALQSNKVFRQPSAK